MGIFLAGAGPDYRSFPEVFVRFARDIPGQRGRARPARIVLVVHSQDGNAKSALPDYAGPLTSLVACEIVPILLRPGSPADPAAFDDAEAVVVGGGLTPAYLEGLEGSAEAIAARVADGAPYLGFSAGAMVAPGRGIVGGYCIEGVEVCAEECSEDLFEIEVRDGLGLVPFSVDVHAAQAGTLSRAVGAVAAGLVKRAVAVDENTALVLPNSRGADFHVIGRGNCWDIRSAGTGCTVTLRAAGT